MTLTERFIDFSDWADSRKTALAGVLISPSLLVILVFLAFARPPAFDVPILTTLLVLGIIIGTVMAVTSWIVYQRGKAGHWTAFTFMFSYHLWGVVTLFSLGGLTSPFTSLMLFLPVFMALWYGTRLAVISVVYDVALMVAGGALNLTGAVTFAPAMEVRNIDGLNTISWFAVTVFALLFTALFVYLVAFVAVAAADLQRRRLRVAHGLIRRYVPEQVADAVLSGAPEAVGAHERRKLTVFFSDLVGFTDLSDELEPEDLAQVLHDYFTDMDAIARRHGGTVDDLVGDAILVLFGAPEMTDDRDQALRAVHMAIEMQQAMGPLNERWASAGIPETLTVRMGVNTGVATVGNFGSENRTKYTALGKQVNIAARIQAQCEPGKVLLSHSTWLLVRDEISCLPKGELTLKGLHRPMPAYEV